MDFRPLAGPEADKLREALRRNAEQGRPIVLDHRDTSFVAGGDGAELTTAEVVNAIKSVPCHYAVETYTLPRTGDAPLKFTGEPIAASCGKRLLGKDNNRWHDLAVYSTESGYVVAIQYGTQWQGESGYDLAAPCRTPAEVRKVLRDHDPTARLGGFPPGDAYADRQARLVADLRARYEQQVSEVLAGAGEDFAEDASAEPADAELMRRSHLLRYRQLLAIGLREAEWTEAEASLICDALNGHHMADWGESDDPESAPRSWQWWPAEVEDAIRLNHLDRKWHVDRNKLAEKIRALSALGLAAVADAAERFWREHAQDETLAGLREVGLIGGPAGAR